MSLIKCSECGKDVSPNANNCPHCGNPIKSSVDGAEQKTCGFSIAGFVLGLVSMFIDPFGLCGLLAVIFSGSGLAKIKQTGQKGKGLAIAGLVLGIIALVWLVIKIIFWEDISNAFGY